MFLVLLFAISLADAAVPSAAPAPKAQVAKPAAKAPAKSSPSVGSKSSSHVLPPVCAVDPMKVPAHQRPVLARQKAAAKCP
jgi:hypothetical protein